MAIFTFRSCANAARFLHFVNGDRAVFVAAAGGVGVKRGHDLKPFLFKSTVREQRESKIADAYEHDWLQAGRAEDFGNHVG